MDQHLAELQTGPLYPFADWPNPEVPKHGAGVYTIWQDDLLVYVGMSGRGITVDTPVRAAPQGIFTRLGSHAGGRRSGDQFCVYVADRMVLPELTAVEIKSVADAQLIFDDLVKKYIRGKLAYRFTIVPDGATAFRIEDAVKNGALGQLPMLNPGRRADQT